MRSFLLKRIIFLFTAFLIPALFLILISASDGSLSSAANTNVDNWGLSFQTPGECPVGNAGRDELKKYNAFFVGDSNKKVLYLSFDAGYENGYTPKILDVLKAHNAPACFFVVGNYIETAPELVKRMISEGHLVGNHSYSHPDISMLSDDELTEELKKNEELFKSTTGIEMSKLYRPPQGKYSVANLKKANSMGYKTVFWSLAYVDWLQDKQPSRDEAFSKLIPRIHNGAVILLHSTSSTNAEILDELLTEYENMGFSFGKLTELS